MKLHKTVKKRVISIHACHRKCYNLCMHRGANMKLTSDGPEVLSLKNRPRSVLSRVPNRDVTIKGLPTSRKNTIFGQNAVIDR